MSDDTKNYEPVTEAGLLVQDLCRSAISATYGEFGQEPKTPNEIARIGQEAIATVGAMSQRRAAAAGDGDPAGFASAQTDLSGSLAHLLGGASAGVKLAELVGPQPLSGETVSEVLDNAEGLIEQVAERLPGSDPEKQGRVMSILGNAVAELRLVFDD